MLDTKLIENALALTDTGVYGFWEDTAFNNYESFFSIEKFCYYLLSPEFVEKYSKTINGEFFFDGQEERVARMFGLNIYRFQSGDEEPLIDLLSKIGN